MSDVLDIIKSALITGAATASVSVLANISYRNNNNGALDWRDLAIISCIGTVLGTRFAETNKPWFSPGR
jgi:hypothetical protein